MKNKKEVMKLTNEEWKVIRVILIFMIISVILVSLKLIFKTSFLEEFTDYFIYVGAVGIIIVSIFTIFYILIKKRINKVKNNKNGQEEMVGFALIMIFVFVILLIFLSFYLKNSSREAVKSYEVGSFMGAMTQYTTECEIDFEYISVGSLIKECGKESNLNSCKNGFAPCVSLNKTLNELIKKSWNVGQDKPIKGYILEITSDEDGTLKQILVIKEGNITNKNFNSKGDSRILSNAGKDYEIKLQIYSE